MAYSEQDSKQKIRALTQYRLKPALENSLKNPVLGSRLEFEFTDVLCPKRGAQQLSAKMAS